MTTTCTYLQQLTQVSDVAHGPLVLGEAQISLHCFKEWISFFWGLLKCKLHWVKGTYKAKLSAYIYICFNQNLDEKFYISAKIEAVKHLINYAQCFC